MNKIINFVVDFPMLCIYVSVLMFEARSFLTGHKSLNCQSVADSSLISDSPLNLNSADTDHATSDLAVL